jgi:hypothetical protein
MKVHHLLLILESNRAENEFTEPLDSNHLIKVDTSGPAAKIRERRYLRNGRSGFAGFHKGPLDMTS